MTEPTIVVHPNAEVLAEAVAARLITKLIDVKTARGEASVALTGGRVGIATLRAVAASPARDAVDWSRVDIWWGDERFLPTGDAERNETQAREALLDHVLVDPDRVHPMPPSDGALGDDPEAAAAAYADEVDGARIDVLLLGVGPDGHVASLFPGHPALRDSRAAVAIRNAPKPPPTRISLSMPPIQGAAEVWLVVAGDDKAAVVQRAIAGDETLPAAHAHGTDKTLWLLDSAATTG